MENCPLRKIVNGKSVVRDVSTMLTIQDSDLPREDAPVRWVKARRRMVGSAILGGMLTKEEAMRRYRMSEEEITSWLADVRGKIASMIETGILRG